MPFLYGFFLPAGHFRPQAQVTEMPQKLWLLFYPVFCIFSPFRKRNCPSVPAALVKNGNRGYTLPVDKMIGKRGGNDGASPVRGRADHLSE